MEILQIRVMRGPNYWSTTQNNLIVLKLKLPELTSESEVEELGNKIYFFNAEFKSLKKQKTISQLIGHLALDLQSIAEIDLEPNEVITKDQDLISFIVFPYTIESAGILAAQAAVIMIDSILSNKTFNLENEIQKLRTINRRESLGPSTRSMVQEAKKRDIPYTRLDNSSLLMFGQGSNQKIIRTAIASTTSTIAVDLVSNKDLTKRILAEGSIPTPKGLLIESIDEIQKAIKSIGFPLVVKPLNGNHGRGISTNINSIEETKTAFKIAKKVAEKVIIEKHIKGSDFRFLVINYKLIAVAKRLPAQIKGNGYSTIKELVDQVNSDPRRGVGHEKVLTTITIDSHTKAILAAKKLTIESILPKKEVLVLKNTANISTGGTADDVTDIVHPRNVFIAERVSRLMGLNICGIDIIAEDISVPLSQENGAILEVNAGPGLRMHLAPARGLSRNVAAPIIDMLFPKTASSRIPIVAITGTNGKTTTTRLIAYLAKKEGYNVGFTTTDGVFINDDVVKIGDCSGPQSAATILRDPLVNFAVLETARGGILRSGLGFDKCNISIVTNVTKDHMGLDGIDTLEDLAKVKSVVPQSTLSSGYAILNADDDLVYEMKNNLTCNVALFSMFHDNERLKTHLSEGKIVAFIKDGFFVICMGEWIHKIIKVNEVPLTYGGKVESMVKNVMPAILTAFISNFQIRNIQEALKAFVPSPENTPGRMNLFEFKNFKLIVDYVHNVGGYQELKKYTDQISASVKIGIFAATGDRRAEDIINIGKIAAEIFDEIIIRHNKDSRGRENEQLSQWLIEGIRQTKPEMAVKIISNEIEAIKYAIDNAQKNAWIFISADKVSNALLFVKEAHHSDHLDNIVLK